MPRMTATQRLKVMQCRVCGRDMQVGSNTRKAPRCEDCATDALAENARQMQAKSGPQYEKWRNGMARALER